MLLTLLMFIKNSLSVFLGFSCDVRGLRCFEDLGRKLRLHFVMYEALGC